MFCTQGLAARVDRAEARLCAHAATLAPDPAADVAPCVIDVGGGKAIFAGPGSPMNKMIGCGFDGPVDVDELSLVEDRFADLGADLQAEVSTLADAGVHRVLCGRGYTPQGFEQVLGHPLTATIEPIPSGITVEAAGPAELPRLLDVLVDGFTHPDTGGVGVDQTPPADQIRRWCGVMLELPGACGFLARLDGEIAGAATLRIDAGIAQFCGAATLPRFRRRGTQTGLLRARLTAAAQAGCEVGVVVTQPASKSQQNCQREGFAPLYLRQLLVRPA